MCIDIWNSYCHTYALAVIVYSLLHSATDHPLYSPLLMPSLQYAKLN